MIPYIETSIYSTTLTSDMYTGTTYIICILVRSSFNDYDIAGMQACSYMYIDNHDSGYLGMAVQLYVQAHLGHYHILTQKEYSQKLMAQLKSTPHFTYICII